MSSGHLNEYHLQFLKRLLDRECRFLIIGGQARSIHNGTATRDLDVWVDISSTNPPALDLALFGWATDHRSHSSADFSELPLPLRPDVQIKFPDADVFFVGADGTLKEIGPEECVDILTSVGSASFHECYSRACWKAVAGMVNGALYSFRYLSITALDSSRIVGLYSNSEMSITTGDP